MSNKMSPSLENYLETIFECIEKKGEARVTEIALEIGISKPSVHQALVSLAKMELINYERYAPLTLTEFGQERAAQIHKRHHVFEAFLTEILNVPKEIAQQDACRMEHVVSEITFEGFVEYLEKRKGKE